LAIDEDSAGATEGLAAAKLGAGQADPVPQRPKKRHIGLEIKFLLLPVYRKSNHEAPLDIKTFSADAKSYSCTKETLPRGAERSNLCLSRRPVDHGGRMTKSRKTAHVAKYVRTTR
jgi:hypothetical protein